jgi:hypothetical protein
MLLPQVDHMANAVFDHVGEKLVRSRKAKNCWARAVESELKLSTFRNSP